jgi:hypothetical protein
MLPRLLGKGIQMHGQLAELVLAEGIGLCQLAHGGGVFLNCLKIAWRAVTGSSAAKAGLASTAQRLSMRVVFMKSPSGGCSLLQGITQASTADDIQYPLRVNACVDVMLYSNIRSI